MTKEPTSNYNTETLKTISKILGNISGNDHSNTAPDVSLELDSIIRLSMVVEIENHFEIEIDTGEIEPEIFDSLASLSVFVDSVIK